MKTIVSPTEARANLYRLIEDVSESHTPVTIAGKQHSAVLVSQEDWDSIQETLYLVSIPGMKESIIEGINTPINECDGDLDW